jgi:prohibitin 2
MNDGQEALRRLANQLRRAGNGGAGGPVGPKGLFAGGGALLALVAGGLALSASLFNGMAHWVAMLL